jgi:hypothetical protein
MHKTIITLIAISLLSCGHHYELSKDLVKEYDKRASQKSDVLVVASHNCNPCSEYSILQGKISFAAEPGGRADSLSVHDIKICGNFPADLNNDPNTAYRISGKTIKAGSGDGAIPVFYVERWESFDFSKEGWQKKDEKGIYAERPKMINDINRFGLFDGQPVSAITNLLGPPDNAEKNKLTWLVADVKASGFDPAYTTTLNVLFGDDGIILSKTVTETEKGR